MREQLASLERKGLVELYYFGPASKRLLAAYHPAGPGPDRDCGVVLCHPFGPESIRAHRAFMKLARRLAAAGFPTLRFDYYGCGDSEGRHEDGTVRQWLEDIVAAVDELREGCELREICLVGLRFGASLAVLAAGRRRDVKSLVLWEPVVRGRSYLAELEALHDQWLRGSFANASSVETGLRELLGFPLSERLAGEIEAFEPAAVTDRPAEDLLLITGGSPEPCSPLLRRLEALGTRTESRVVSAPPVWVKADEGDEFGGGLVPVAVLTEIVSWLSGARP